LLDSRLRGNDGGLLDGCYPSSRLRLSWYDARLILAVFLNTKVRNEKQ
jgi:hypothetical protein